MLRLAATTRRLGRPAVALALVVAQAVSAFGFPLVGSRAGASPCGCTTPCGNSPENCCCKPAAPVKPASCPNCGGEPGACCHTLASLAPKPAKCAKCRDRAVTKLTDCATCPGESPSSIADDESEPVVTWVAGFKARQCRGDGPLGLLAEMPSVPPAESASPVTMPVPVGVVRISDASSTSHFTAPLDPPPRCG
jgi:hypothetical protein